MLSRYARVYQWACRVPASVAAKLAGVRADSSIFYYLDGRNILADVIVLLIYSTLTNTNLDLLGAGSTGTAFL